jgi:Flp pilus assembly protein CpaB
VKRSNRLLILVGVLLAVTGAVGAMVIASGGTGTSASKSTPTPVVTPEPQVTVVVATKDISPGQQITADMVSSKKVPVSTALAAGGDTFVNPDLVINKIAGAPIQTGQIIVASRDLLSPGTLPDGQSIAAEVHSGMLAVSMEVDQVNGVGTVIVPGDRVDVILSVYVAQLGISVKSTDGVLNLTIPSDKDVTTKMVIQNRRVLGTLLPTTSTTATTPSANGSAAPVPQSTTPTVSNNDRHMIVIVEVTPQEAEVLRWAQREEKLDPQNYIDLSLALRSSSDNDLPDATTTGVTLKMLVDKYGVLAPDPRAVIPPDIAATIQW